MPNFLNKEWFLLKPLRDVDLSYLCYADTFSEASRKFGYLVEGREIVQLTWAEISELTGCAIPALFKPEDFAHGSLVMRHGDKLFVIWTQSA